MFTCKPCPVLLLKYVYNHVSPCIQLSELGVLHFCSVLMIMMMTMTIMMMMAFGVGTPLNFADDGSVPVKT